MPFTIPERDLPTALTTEQAVEAAYAAEMATVASHLLRGLLVAVEMALALSMVAGTLVTVRGFRSLANEDLERPSGRGSRPRPIAVRKDQHDRRSGP